MKNHTHKLTGILVATALIMPVFASAQSTGDVSSQIQALLGQITSLQQQLHTLMGSMGSTTHAWASDGNGNNNDNNSSNGGDSGRVTTTNTGGSGDNVPCINIARDIRIGAHGDDVSQIQGVLAQNGFLPSTSTTGFFGKLTARAMTEFADHLGISGSTTGSIGSNIRNFFRARCANGKGPFQGMGSTTHPTTDGNHGGWSPEGTGSTTHPCPRRTTNSESDAAAVALALFEPHSILPPDMHPCNLGVWHSSPASSTAGSW